MRRDDLATRDLVRMALGPSADASLVADRLLAKVREGGGRRLSSRKRAQRWRVRLWTVAGLLLVLIAGNLVAARVSPNYASALAKAPLVGVVAGPLLNAVGLTPPQLTAPNNQVSSASSATSDGHTLAIVGGYADTSRTVIVIQVDGRNTPLSKTAATYDTASGMYHGRFMDPTVFDQYGHSYDIGGGIGQDLTFGPLVGRAAHGPVRLTLLVPTISFFTATTVGVPAKETTVNGDWKVSLTLTQHPATVVSVPAPITVGDITYQITSIVVSSSLVSIDWRASGGTEIASLFRQSQQPGGPDVAPGSSFETISNLLFSASIETAGGTSIGDYAGGYGVGITYESPTVIGGSLATVLRQPGTYFLAIGVPTLIRFPITIPG